MAILLESRKNEIGITIFVLLEGISQYEEAEKRKPLFIYITIHQGK